MKAYGLAHDGAGTRFYQFDNIPSARDFKQVYRARLDGLGVSQQDADKIVAEANVAFRLNTAIFEELDVLCGLATAEEVGTARKERQGRNTAEEVGDDAGGPVAAKCPFAKMGGVGGIAPHGNRAAAVIAADVSSNGAPTSQCPVSLAGTREILAQYAWAFLGVSLAAGVSLLASWTTSKQ